MEADKTVEDAKVEETTQVADPVVETAEPVESVIQEDASIQGAKMEVPADEETAKRIGVKETAQNADVMAMQKAESEDGGEGPVAPPSFFVDEEKRHRIEVDILCSKKDGSILSVSRTDIGIDYKEFKYLNHFVEWFEFTLPTYEEMSTYRQRCGVYRKEAQQVIIDRLQLRNFLLVWHLKDWSLRDKDGKPVPLAHEENGALSDASMRVVYKTHTTILDVVLTILEKDLLLT